MDEKQQPVTNQPPAGTQYAVEMRGGQMGQGQGQMVGGQGQMVGGQGQMVVGQGQMGGQTQYWMPAPSAQLGCPPGLEYLTQIDQLLVHQVVELFEVMTGWECRNRYQMKNSVGQQVYFAGEESDICMRQCCGNARGFNMHIVDNNQQEVLRCVREFKCCAGCCWCANVDHCAFEISVEAPVGTTIGYVRQSQYCWVAEFDILDANRQTVLKVKGPCCICYGICCTWDQEFTVYTKDMATELGKVSKQWAGIGKEMCTNANNFSITFPMDMDVKTKATLIGACFLIDFMFFEKNQK